MPNNWLELSRANLLGNLAGLRRLVGTARIMPVVKANAYGAGAEPIAQALAAEGVGAFAVASVREAVELREAGIPGAIVVLTYFLRDEVDAILAHDLSPVVFTHDHVAWLAERAEARATRARAWVKVDTGLGRIGVPAREAADFVRWATKEPRLRVEGLLSTLSENPERNPLQVTRLVEVRAQFSEGAPLPLSLASSQGILSLPESYLDVVRPGIMLLGVAPGRERLDTALVGRAELRPVVTWKARVAYTKTVPRGEQVGYGVRQALERDTPVATLAVGWADGYPQTIQGSGHLLLRGRRCPVLSVSANSTMADLTGLPGIASGEGRTDAPAEGVLLGRQGVEEIGVEELARFAGSVYRLLATIPASVPRIWSQGE